MKLYHFTSLRHSDKIFASGAISKGVIPWAIESERVKFITGYQWLTSNDEFTQSWDTSYHLPYRRTEVRLAIDIPKYAYKSVYRWMAICAKFHPQSEPYLNTGHDISQWFLFSGKIPTDWIIEKTINPQKPQIDAFQAN